MGSHALGNPRERSLTITWVNKPGNYHIQCFGVSTFSFEYKPNDVVFWRRIVCDDPKLLGDSGEVPISEWSGWLFDSYYEIFSLLDGKN